MPVKKKTTHKNTAETSEEVKEKVQPPVTQVVEVVNDESEETKGEAESAPAPDQQEGKTETPQMETEPRLDVINELFKQDEPVGLPELRMQQNKRSKVLFWWTLGVLGVAVLIGTGMYFATRGSFALPKLITEPTPTSTNVPSPTPTQIPKDVISIQVLNGSGVAGAGSKMKSYLEEKGYKVADVGNAKAYSYDETEVRVKQSKSEYLTLLEEDLKNSYTVGSTSANLPEDFDYDVQIIVGEK